MFTQINQFACICTISLSWTLPEKKEDIWLSPMTKAPTPTEKSKKQRDNIKNATKNFDYTTIADRLRTVSWSNDSYTTGAVKPVYGIPIFPLTTKAVCIATIKSILLQLLFVFLLTWNSLVNFWNFPAYKYKLKTSWKNVEVQRWKEIQFCLNEWPFKSDVVWTLKSNVVLILKTLIQR